ncbi:hypothetical protein ACCC88_15620 [Sphingomonas sp. Sphisp140]|uniref:hypothetical protein n=1 Tax=unclassified Sphingomonas TaxID=196159 RepID=UPI0039AF1073
MAKRLALIGFLAAIATAPAAHACSVIVDHEPTYAERRAEARKTIADAAAILDGEVVEPADIKTHKPAKIRVVRVFKGEVPEFVYVKSFTSCDIDFTTAGERWRFVLQNGPQVYSTWVDYSNARHIDRLLRSDRREDWPLFPRKQD